MTNNGRRMDVVKQMNELFKKVVNTLLDANQVRILTHKNPDGDTLGSAFGLCAALRKLGKEAEVCCSDPIPEKFSYMKVEDIPLTKEPDLIVSVDVADPQLLGTKLDVYRDCIDVCIDHHKTNTMQAKLAYIDENAGSTCEVIYRLLCAMNTPWDEKMANSVYTGVCTDTGCFKFSNTTARTHRIAADLIELGCAYDKINQELFDTKSRGRIIVERKVLDSIEFYYDNQVAMVEVPLKLVEESGIDGSELDGVSAMPRQIEGVEIGITLRERAEGGYKISLRTRSYADAAVICSTLGGGGHARAAGCAIDADLDTTKKLLLDAISGVFETK